MNAQLTNGKEGNKKDDAEMASLSDQAEIEQRIDE